LGLDWDGQPQGLSLQREQIDFAFIDNTLEVIMPEVKIRDIQSGMSNIEVTGRITKMGERRNVQTKFGSADVATATLEDETGSIGLSLWRQQIDMVKEGDEVKLINAFTRVFGGKTQLNIGKEGEIINIGKE